MLKLLWSRLIVSLRIPGLIWWGTTYQLFKMRQPGVRQNQKLQGASYDQHYQRRIIIFWLIRSLVDPTLAASWHFVSLRPETRDERVLRAQASSRYGSWNREGAILQFMCLGSWAGVTYLRYTVLMSHSKDEAAVHFCHPARDLYR